MRLALEPLTPRRWDDFEAVFRARGCSVARGCWCMYYRLSGERTGWPTGGARTEANRQAMKALVEGGEATGLLGYRDGVPVGWISLGPRERFAKLRRSPVMRAVDDQPVWSVICFVIPKEHRGMGVARELLQGAIRYARKQKVKWLEAYPKDPGPTRVSDDSLWFGPVSMYADAGFVEVARRKPTRPVMRLRLGR